MRLIDVLKYNSPSSSETEKSCSYARAIDSIKIKEYLTIRTIFKGYYFYRIEFYSDIFTYEYSYYIKSRNNILVFEIE